MYAKLWLCLLIVFVLGAGTAVSAAAADTSVKIYDEAQLLTEEEEAVLAERARSIGERYTFDVAVVLIDDNGGKSSMEYADDFYDENGFGTGADASGSLLLVDMDDRVVWISTAGRGIRIFTDARINSMTAEIGPYLTDEKYAKAVEVFLDETERYLEKPVLNEPVYEAVLPVQPQAQGKDYGSLVLISVAIGLGCGALVVGIMVANHGISVPKTSTAYQYRGRPLQLQVNRDQYLRRHVSRQARSSNSSSGSSSGSSVHRSSSGRSHGGGGRSF